MKKSILLALVAALAIAVGTSSVATAGAGDAAQASAKKGKGKGKGCKGKKGKAKGKSFALASAKGKAKGKGKGCKGKGPKPKPQPAPMLPAPPPPAPAPPTPDPPESSDWPPSDGVYEGQEGITLFVSGGGKSAALDFAPVGDSRTCVPDPIQTPKAPVTTSETLLTVGGGPVMLEEIFGEMTWTIEVKPDLGYKAVIDSTHQELKMPLCDRPGVVFTGTLTKIG